MEKRIEDELVALIKDNIDDIYGLVYNYVRNEQDVNDVISEATYKSLKNIKSLREKRYMKTWLYRIFINESLALIKKRKQIVYDDSFLDMCVGTSDEDRDSIIDLYNSIDKLPDIYKNALLLKHIKGYKIEEISEITNTNINTVKSRIKRGLEKLREIMEG